VASGGTSLTVLTNNGRGDFSLKSTTITSSTSGTGSGMVVAADMNGDGKVDLVCPLNGNGIQGYGVVLTNDGTGNFTVNTTAPIGIAGDVNYPNFVTAADFNGDGNKDFVVSCFGSATLTVLTQINVAPLPIVTITSPANDALVSTSDSFVIHTTVETSNQVEIVLVYLGSELLGAGTNSSFDLTLKAGKIPAGIHPLQAVCIDSSFATGWSPEIQINVTGPTVVVPPPTVTIMSPTNGTVLTTAESFTVKAATTGAVSSVQLYLDGQALEGTTATPYNFQIAAGSLAAGGHTLQAVAVNSQGGSGSSSLVYITLNLPGTSLIDFDALNTSAGDVGGTALAGYLAQYGVSITSATAGSVLEAVNTNGLPGTVEVEVPSSPNFFTQAGVSGPVSFTLTFAAPLQSFGFTRVGLTAASGLVSHPRWTATIFDGNGTALESVSEGLYLSASPLAEKSFVLTGTNITSVRFDSDSQGVAAFSGVLLDNLDLNSNPSLPALSVGMRVVSPATNDLVAPATLVLGASIQGSVDFSHYVSFYAGPNLLGSVSNSPYELTVPNLLAGNYQLQAKLTYSTGVAAFSALVPVTVQLPTNATKVDFDASSLATGKGPGTVQVLTAYLAGYGLTVSGLTAGTALAVENQALIAGGGLVLASSPPNLLTQTGGSGPVQFTLNAAAGLGGFGFTRPELLAKPFVSHPAWQVTALDGAGNVVGQVGEGEIDSSTNVGARVFSLGGAGGAPIAGVVFASEGSGLTTFNAMLVDDLVLTTNAAAVPPAVAITSPVSGVVLAAPPALTVTAAATDAAGIVKVRFYANGEPLGVATSSPFALTWTNPAPGSYTLTALAVDGLGLSRTSAGVTVVIQPSAYQFGITAPPASQTVAAGGSVTFAVTTTGTNLMTYQWAHNKAPINGATASTLVVGPPIADSDAGSYTVTVTSTAGSLVGGPAILTVVDPPNIATQPAGQTLAAGTDLALSVTPAGQGPFTYQWLLNGTSLAGATNSSFVAPSAQPLNSGNYQVVVSDLAASALSAVAPVVVLTAVTIPGTNNSFASRTSIDPLSGPVAGDNLSAPVQTLLPDNLPGGNSIWFTWTATFTGNLSLTTQGSDFDTVMAVYTGSAAGRLTPVAADDDSGGALTSLVAFNVTKGTAYQIAVDGFQGAAGRVVLGQPAGTGYRILNPSSGAAVPVIVKEPAGQSAAAGAKATLSVTASSATKLSYQWQFQGTPIAGATGSSLVVGPLRPSLVGYYSVLVANAAGSAQSEAAEVQITSNVGGAAATSQGKFINTTGGAKPASLAEDLTPQDVGGDTRGFSVAQVFSTVGAEAEAGEPEPCGQVGTASQWFSYTAPGTGILQINTDGSSFNTILGVYTGSGTSFASLAEVGCGYATNYLAQGQPGVTLPEVVKGTKYYILVAGYQGARGVARLQIGLGQKLAFSGLPESRWVTAGSNATFAVGTTGSIPTSYQWQLNGANVEGGTQASYTVTNAEAGAVGNYTVIVSNVVGVATSSPPAVLTLQFAPAIVSGPTNETVLLGQATKFSVTAIGVNTKNNPFVSRWYFGGEPLSKATNLVLSLTKTYWTNNGDYYLVISNSYGATTSAVVTLTLLDKTPPTATMISPANNAVSESGTVVVSGTASDNVAVAEVEVQVNGGAFAVAAGSTNWSITVGLVPGANVIGARSLDTSSNVSALMKRTVVYKLLAVPESPAETGGKNGSGTGGGPTSADAVKDLDPSSSGTVSEAAGTYSGLFYPATGASQTNAGYFTATVESGSGGAFTGYILLDEGRYAFSGEFDATGDAETSVALGGGASVGASLHLPQTLGGGGMTGVISNADWVSPLQAGVGAENPPTKTAPGLCARFVVISTSGGGAPVGSMTLTNGVDGTAVLSGILAGGWSFLGVAPVGAGGVIPLYAPRTSGDGLVLGWINLTNAPGQTDFGRVWWFDPSRTNQPVILLVK
jgi:hypothetical protein